MRFSNFAYMVAGNLAERKGRTLGAVLVIAFTVAVVLAVASLGAGFLRGIMAKAAEAFPPTVLLVKPQMMNIAMLAFNTGVIDRELIEKVEALPGVDDVAAQLSMKMPLQMEVEIAGQHAMTDGVVVGVEPETVADDVDPRFNFKYDENSTQPVPSIVPRFLIDMYNLAYSESMGLPKMNEGYLLGKKYTLHVGETVFMGGDADKKTDIDCRIVGLSSKANLVAGVYIPLKHAEELNRWYTGKETNEYTALHVTVRDLEQLDQVTSSIREMNLNVEGNRETFETIRFATRAAGAVITLFATVVVAIAAVCILNLFTLIMFQRTGEAALMRAVGGTRRRIMGLYLVEVAIIGLVGGLLGLAVAGPVLRVLDKKAISSLPKLPFVPDHLFAAGPGLMLLCLLGALLLSLVAVLPPLLATVRGQNPAQAAVE